MELLNLLNPVYVLGNIIGEIDSAISSFDFSQPQTWLLVGVGYCLLKAASPLLDWTAEKLVAMRK